MRRLRHLSYPTMRKHRRHPRAVYGRIQRRAGGRRIDYDSALKESDREIG